MTTFTDIYIKRPVLSTVISLMILLLGLVSLMKISIRQYPLLTNSVITVTTAYPGANPDTVQGFITKPLQQAVGSADGIDYMTASSTLGVSTITVFVKLNYDSNSAMTNISAKVNSVLSQLPADSKPPTIDMQTGDNFPIFFLSLSSDTLNTKQITSYAETVLTPQINTVGGISKIQIWGGDTYAMRIWLDPKRMAVLGVTADDVNSALLKNNVQAAPGQFESHYNLINIKALTDLNTAQQFDDLVVKSTNENLIRIKDVGYAELGSESYDSVVMYNNKPAVFLTVRTTPDANPLSVVDGITEILPSLEKKFPPGLQAQIAYDSTIFVRESLKEVFTTVVEAILIVVVVIFLFIGSLRAVLIPVVTIPLSIIGVCFLMLLMGFSINLLTLLAMVLAIGLVVDDAIVVLENIYRNMEEGMNAFDAAIEGARQIAMPVVVMTLTLAAVFAPIGFLGGVTGTLFKEFAFTLAASVIISGVIALTFSPMLCARMLNPSVLHGTMTAFVDKTFMKLETAYERTLQAVIKMRLVVYVLVVMIFIACFLFYNAIPKELAPQEDQGTLRVIANAPTYANLDYLKKYIGSYDRALKRFEETAARIVIAGFPATYNILAIIRMTPWDERTLTQMDLRVPVQKVVNQIAGLESQVVQIPSLPGTPFGPPVNFVITSTGSVEALYDVMKNFEQVARQSGMFSFISGDLDYDTPQLNITVDREKAAAMGVEMNAVANTLNVLYGENNVNYFSQLGYSFEVIPQMQLSDRINISTFQSILLPTRSGKLITLWSLADVKQTVQPAALNQFQQLNSVTLGGAMVPGVTLGQALDFLAQTAENILPQDMSYDYAAGSRQFIDEGSAIMLLFGLAVLIIFLLLAAQFESFRDPFIILFTVPLSLFGAMLPLYLGISTINIYTQIGFVTLIGLITKHGILIVEFANHLQQDGASQLEAIVKACGVRLRPVLMTTAAMVFGVVPLILASGAGAVSRQDIGVVIASGMSIGTCFTLFVIPVMYMTFGRRSMQSKSA